MAEGESSWEESTASVMAGGKGCQKISLQKAVSPWGIPERNGNLIEKAERFSFWILIKGRETKRA